MPAVTFTQDSFSGGMNLVDLGTKVKSNEYIVGLNLRSRFGYLEPVMEPIDVTGDLDIVGRTIQGLYAFGDILVLFLGGLAYYKDVSISDGEWTLIENFQMSSQVTRIYTQAVPGSDQQYLRTLDDEGEIGPDGTVILDPTGALGTSRVALVCQDGVNQPWLIFNDGTAQEAGLYDDWNKDGPREYVPIGKQMCYSNGILYIVEPNGKFIYRSVSGRPLDFVIAIDADGDKVADAEVTSFAVDGNEIKLIAASNSSNDIITISAYSAWLSTPDFENTIYGEPRFRRTFLFTAGTINQFCLGDLLGDTAFIDREGLKSFNAVQQLKFEGNNSVFSLGISKLFKGIVQDDNACIGSFDNYVFFGVKTTYSSSSIIVYDSVLKVFSSIDLFSTKPIKQFASTYSSSRQRFFGITSDKVYELYSPDSLTPATATFFSRDLDSRSTDQGSTYGIANIKPQVVNLIFEDSLIEGQMNLDVFVNNERQDSEGSERTIPLATSGIYYPVVFPVMFTIRNGVVPISIPLKVHKEGQKIGHQVTWTGGAKLTYLINESDCANSPSSIQQQNRIYA